MSVKFLTHSITADAVRPPRITSALRRASGLAATGVVALGILAPAALAQTPGPLSAGYSGVAGSSQQQLGPSPAPPASTVASPVSGVLGQTVTATRPGNTHPANGTLGSHSRSPGSTGTPATTDVTSSVPGQATRAALVASSPTPVVQPLGGPASPPPVGTLPFTGVDVRILFALGMLMILAGVAVRMLPRRGHR